MTAKSEYWHCHVCGARNIREDGPICDNCGADGRDEPDPDDREPSESELERIAENVGVPLWMRV